MGMSQHDPLCLCEQCVAHDNLCTTVLNTEMSEVFCNCEAIRRVREDERNCGCKFWRGYAAALADAVAAVEALDPNAPGGNMDYGINVQRRAVAAITALGGER